MGIEHEFVGDEFDEFFFDFHHVLAGGDTGAITDPEDMRIDGNGRFAKGGIQHHIGGFAPDPGQGLEGFAIPGDLAAM